MATLHPSACSLPGVGIIEPAVQGDYDGLCGLYCIINAIRLVLAPHQELKRDEVRALFAAGGRHLDRQEILVRSLRLCIDGGEWTKLAERVVAKARRFAVCPIVLERTVLATDAPIEDTLLRIEQMITSGLAPCVFFRGKTRHYSVISGYTPASLKLFDSFGYKRFLRSSCGTQLTTTSLHRFHMQSVIAIGTRASPRQ